MTQPGPTVPPAAEAGTDVAADMGALTSNLPTDLNSLQDYWSNNSELITSYAVKVIGVIVVLFVAWIIAGWVSAIIRKPMRKLKIDETLTRFIGKTAKWAILLFAVLGCLGLFGVDVTSFAVVVGAMGLAVGLAFQGTLSNLAAGVMLLIFRPFKVDDVVNVAGITGKIYEIGLFSTHMDTPDNRRMIVPNSQIFGATIENITHHAIRRVDVAVGADYGADLDKTREVLMAVAQKHHVASTGKDPQVYMTELGASSVDYAIRVWAATADYWGVREALMVDVKKALDNANIGIPFPQMDVHLDKLDSGAA